LFGIQGAGVGGGGGGGVVVVGEHRGSSK